MNLRRADAATFSWPRVAIAEGFAVLLLSVEWLGLDADDDSADTWRFKLFRECWAPFSCCWR